MTTASDVIASWLSGQDGLLHAPFARPGQLARHAAEAGSRPIVVVDTDLAALVHAATGGGALLIRTSDRAARRKALQWQGGSGSPFVVTSLESLHSPVLRREFAEHALGAPWILWRADRLLSPADDAWQADSLEAHRRAARAGALLDVVARPREGVPTLLSEPGVLRVVDGPVLPLEERSWALIWGGSAEDCPTALPRRDHALSAPDPRRWRETERSLRERPRGVEMLAAHPSMTLGVGRLTAYVSPPTCVADLAAPLGSVVLLRPPTPPAADQEDREVLIAAVDRCREALRGQAGEGWLAWPGGTTGDTPDALVEDLARLRVLVGLRSTWLLARVADSQRFRTPMVDAEPSYKELHRLYSEASSQWTLAEKSELALDHRERDLRPLARSVGKAPAEIADVLLAMDEDDLVSARLRPMGESVDWQAAPGPHWDTPTAELIDELMALRGARASEAAVLAGLAAGEGCRVQALANLLGVGDSVEEPCGACDRCDPSGGSWAEALSAEVPSAARLAISHAPSAAAAARLSGLFSGFDQRERVVAHPDEELTARGKKLRGLLKQGSLAAAQEAVELAGGAAAALVGARLRYRQPTGAQRIAPDETVDVLFSALAAEASPMGLPEELNGVGVRRKSGGVIELTWPRSHALQGTHRFELLGDPLDNDERALERLVSLEQRPQLRPWLENREGRRRWAEAMEGLEEAVVAALLEQPGVPEISWGASADGTTQPARVDGDLGTWRPWIEGIATLELPQDMPRIPPTGAELLLAVAAVRAGDLQGLWDDAAVWLGRGRRRRDGESTRRQLPPRSELSVLRRLQLRAVLGARVEHAGHLVTWLDGTPRDAWPDEAGLRGWLSSVQRGARSDFLALADRLADVGVPTEEVAERAVVAFSLPSIWLDLVLPLPLGEQRWSDVAELLVAATPAPDEAGRTWKRAFAEVSPALKAEVEKGLRARRGAVAGALVDAAEAERAVLEARERSRSSLVELAEAGDWAGAGNLLLGAGGAVRPEAGEDRETFERVVAGVRQRLSEVMAPVARALMAGDAAVDEAALAALDDARETGWIRPLAALLRVQARRYPDDPRRARWLALALGRAGQPAEAVRAWRALGELAGSPEGSLDAWFEGLADLQQQGATRDALAWLGELLGQRPSHALGDRVSTWIEAYGGALSGDERARLSGRLRGARSGVYARAMRLLEGEAGPQPAGSSEGGKRRRKRRRRRGSGPKPV